MKIQPLIERFAATIKGYIDKRVGELDIQIKSLPTPKDGRDAADPTDEHLDALIAKRIPEPIPGKDGTSVTMDEARTMLGEIQRAWASEFEQRAQDVLQRSIDNIPLPKDGKDGRDGVDGKAFSIDEATAVIERAIEARQAAWALDFERRAQELFQRAIERIPAPKDGKDGIDAFPLESFKTELRDGGRVMVLKFDDGKRSFEHEHITEFPVNRGVFKDGSSYLCGDEVTFGGSVWAALESTESKPGTDKTWVLRTKRGRDGKDSVKIPRDHNEPVKLR